MASSILREQAHTQRTTVTRREDTASPPHPYPALPKEAKTESQSSKWPSNKQVHDTWTAQTCVCT